MSIFYRIMEIGITNQLHRINHKNHYLYSAYWIISCSFIIISLICLVFMNTYLANIMINVNMNDFGKIRLFSCLILAR